MISDLSFLLTWWLLIFLIGLSFLPLTSKVFAHFYDRGYIFAKILGLAILSYLVFLLGSLKILPFNQESVWLIFALLAILNFGWAFWAKLKQATTNRSLTFHFSTSGLKIILFEEVLFFLAFFFWAWIRAHEPSIRGLEKFMDFGFINSLLRADYFPPRDMWLPPFSINYYYFGHLVTAVLTKLSGIDSAVTYNLMLATLFALTFTGAFSLGLNLFASGQAAGDASRGAPHRTVRGWRAAGPAAAGFLFAFLVTLAGNLHTLYAFIRGFDKYWYPDATRFIPYTIHEFPSYSWVVADLHGHVLDIPFVLLTLALLLSLFTTPFQKNPIPYALYSIPLLLAVMYMTNAWDGLIYFGLAALILFFLHLKIPSPQFFPQSGIPLRGTIFNFQLPFSIFPFLFSIFLLGLGFFLFSLPFTLNFKPFVSGLGLVRDRSLFYMLAILWGFFYFFVISFVVFLRKAMKQWNNVTISDYFVLILIFLSTLLLIFPEFAYVKDIYPLHYRANTMFKLGYQAFIMLSLASAYITVRLFSPLKPHRLLFTIYYLLFTILFLFVAIYPYFSIRSYYNSLKNYQGLNGLSWLSQFYPQDAEAISWLRQNIQGPAGGEARQGRQPVILEAAGESYTDFARVSANTGLPTVIGWPVHEWLWRGSYDEAGKRVAEVQRMYESHDLAETKSLLEKYKVEYVFVGQLERQKYPTADFSKWEKFATPIFSSGQTTLYQIP